MPVERLSAKWPSPVSAFENKVRLDLAVESSSNSIQTEMTTMQAIELGLKLIDRGRDSIKSFMNS